MTKVEGRPDSEGRKAVLKEERQAAKADQDDEIVQAARQLLDRLAQAGQAGGASYQATNSGSGAIAQGAGAVAAGQGA